MKVPIALAILHQIKESNSESSHLLYGYLLLPTFPANPWIITAQYICRSKSTKLYTIESEERSSTERRASFVQEEEEGQMLPTPSQCFDDPAEGHERSKAISTYTKGKENTKAHLDGSSSNRDSRCSVGDRLLSIDWRHCHCDWYVCLV